ncbi:uncharacterized protein ARMOST_19627 [Armillaria ostoyae]|uniref:Uncharacterized protein n=1 Tax=Armillaria ostoyae TaxID=47428 RepID=A0A284S529_ARMOS|nr:uncharacterized protein ARMOST_19627 [Armillaria ostoyae]
MFSKARKTLQFLFYAVLTSYAPYDFRTIPPENTIIFVPDVICRRDRRSQTARSYFSSVAQHCPYGAGEAIVKKIEFSSSTLRRNHSLILTPPHLPWVTPIVQDRRSLSSESASISRTGSHSPSPESLYVPANGLFTITCMPVILIEDYDILSTLTFKHNSRFAIEEAAVIASAAAEECSIPSYLYDRVIYNIILESQAGNLKYTKGKAPPEDIATSKQLTQTYIEKWREFRVDIQERIEVREDSMRRMEEARRQTEAYQREIERMKQELEVLREEPAELTRKQKELDDHKRDLVDRVSSSPPNAT